MPMYGYALVATESIETPSQEHYISVGKGLRNSPFYGFESHWGHRVNSAFTGRSMEAAPLGGAEARVRRKYAIVGMDLVCSPGGFEGARVGRFGRFDGGP